MCFLRNAHAHDGGVKPHGFRSRIGPPSVQSSASSLIIDAGEHPPRFGFISYFQRGRPAGKICWRRSKVRVVSAYSLE